MTRARWTPLIAAGLAALVLVPSAIASIPPVDSAYLARLGPSRFPDDGSATSAIRLFVSGRISVYTRLVNQRPGSRWSVEIFDAGTCANVLAFVATLDGITIGPDGVGSRTVSLTSDQSALLRDALASGRRLVVRLTGSTWQTCQTYRPVDPASLGSSAPTTGTTTGATTATSATGTVTVTTTSATASTSTISSTTVTSSTMTEVVTTESTLVSTTVIEAPPTCVPTPYEDCVPDGPPNEE